MRSYNINLIKYSTGDLATTFLKPETEDNNKDVVFDFDGSALTSMWLYVKYLTILIFSGWVFVDMRVQGL